MTVPILYCFEAVINWDMVPAWIQALTAAVAAFYLVRTFNLQRIELSSQESRITDQQRINRIQYEAFLKGFMPEITAMPYKPVTELNNIQNSDGEILVAKNEARNIIFIAADNDIFSVKPLEIDPKSPFLPGRTFPFRVSYSVKKLPKVADVTAYLGTLFFEDSIGTKYSVAVVLKKDSFLGLEIPVRI